MPQIKILHTNDLHNRLTTEQACFLAVRRRELEGFGFLVDCGDAISAGNIGVRPGGEPILERMSDIGYDLMAVGNREFHFTQYGFLSKLSKAKFPVLSANIQPREGVKSPVVPSITFTTRNGVRVTFFGLTVPMITERMAASKIASYIFRDPLAVAAELAPRIRRDCDLLVCVSHIGLRKDKELAKRVEGIDIILGGHSHDTLPEGIIVEGTMIAQTGFWGHHYGVITVDISDAGKKCEARLYPFDPPSM
jgi:2',3'-cyclic-nucleotide 2'-phosphodiesterase (5'-nucleotidase family)